MRYTTRKFFREFEISVNRRFPFMTINRVIYLKNEELYNFLLHKKYKKLLLILSYKQERKSYTGMD